MREGGRVELLLQLCSGLRPRTVRDCAVKPRSCEPPLWQGNTPRAGGTPGLHDSRGAAQVSSLLRRSGACARCRSRSLGAGEVVAKLFSNAEVKTKRRPLKRRL